MWYIITMSGKLVIYCIKVAIRDCTFDLLKGIYNRKGDVL